MVVIELGKFRAGAPGCLFIALNSRSESSRARRLDIAGVANLILTASNTLLIIHTGEH